MSWFRWDGDDLLLWLRVQPRASRDAFAEVLDDALKVRITAPPVEGKANAHLVAWLARQFRVPKGAVRIESGESGRRKRVRITQPKTLPSPICDTVQGVKTNG